MLQRAGDAFVVVALLVLNVVVDAALGFCLVVVLLAELCGRVPRCRIEAASAACPDAGAHQTGVDEPAPSSGVLRDATPRDRARPQMHSHDPEAS
jgi:hypothetical protein